MTAEKARFYSKFGDVCSHSERFLLLISLGKNHDTDKKDLKTFQQKIAANITSQSNKEHSFIPQRKYYVAVVDQSSCLKHRDQSVDVDWLLLNQLDRGSTNKKGSRSSTSCGDTSIGDDEVFENQEVNANELAAAMAEFIHALANKLPSTGHYLDILWLASPNTDVSINDHITLYGALQRLCSWHDGVLTVVLDDATVDRPQDSTLNTWVNHLHGRVVGLDSVDEVVMGDMAWRGEVLVADGKGQKSVCLPGFSLSPLLSERSKVNVEYVEESAGSKSPKPKSTKPHQTKKIVAFSKQLQVVCSVQIADVPCMYLSPITLSLRLLPGSRLPRSQHYLEWLSSIGRSNDTAVIMRLPCRTLTPRASTQHAKLLSTKEWKEHVKNNSGDLSVPDLNMQETQEFFYLLVGGGNLGGNLDNDVVTAQVMNSPHDLSGAVHAKLAEYQDLLPFDDCENARTTLSTIPSLDGAQLQFLLEEVELIQAEALKKFIEDRKSEGREPVTTFAELRLLMGTVYSTYMATREEFAAIKDQDDVDSDYLRNKNLFSELDVPPSSWMERLALQNHEAIEKKIKRFKSGEMMLAGLSVPAPADNTIKLSAEEFLKHFLASGLPNTEDLCPVGVGAAKRPSGSAASRHVCSSDMDWDQLKKATFEEAQKFISSPGILYCLDSRKSMQVDRHFSKMQQRYIRFETASTCSSEQAASPATLTIPPDPSSATKKGKVHPRLNSRGQRSAEKGQRSAEKQRRLVLDKGSKISPGRLHGRGVKRQRPDMTSVLAAKRRIMPTRTSPRKKPTEMLPTRVSPRKKLTAQETSEDQPLTEKKIQETLTSSSSGNVRKVSRSERTRMKLRAIVKETVVRRGIKKGSECYKACIERLYKMAELYVKDLKTSKGLDEEMKKIAEANVDFAVQFERTRVQKS
ncbi:mdm2-binding protein-like isoform X2 [Asterias amurensis]|uniref:mdm2-binding protein-like isoform X2 n=1 Tax=Asterias amurensis TaxID=7602 RepID=UPI003AB520B4